MEESSVWLVEELVVCGFEVVVAEAQEQRRTGKGFLDQAGQFDDRVVNVLFNDASQVVADRVTCPQDQVRLAVAQEVLAQPFDLGFSSAERKVTAGELPKLPRASLGRVSVPVLLVAADEVVTVFLDGSFRVGKVDVPVRKCQNIVSLGVNPALITLCLDLCVDLVKVVVVFNQFGFVFKYCFCIVFDAEGFVC